MRGMRSRIRIGNHATTGRRRNRACRRQPAGKWPRSSLNRWRLPALRGQHVDSIPNPIVLTGADLQKRSRFNCPVGELAVVETFQRRIAYSGWASRRKKPSSGGYRQWQCWPTGGDSGVRKTSPPDRHLVTELLLAVTSPASWPVFAGPQPS